MRAHCLQEKENNVGNGTCFDKPKYSGPIKDPIIWAHFVSIMGPISTFRGSCRMWRPDLTGTQSSDPFIIYSFYLSTKFLFVNKLNDYQFFYLMVSLCPSLPLIICNFFPTDHILSHGTSTTSLDCCKSSFCI